ncbi:MAG: DEAD/DEAH box helicase, partial [Mycoplasmataceae bacterium]|nr:DEAD/DEAH box helicase [Mycoplasmataceae bacterium]
KFKINYLEFFTEFAEICKIECTDVLQKAYCEHINNLDIANTIKQQTIEHYTQFCLQKLEPIQIQGALWLNLIKKGILAFGTGVGKTFTALEACHLLNSTTNKKKVLIVTLNQITLQWQSEIENNFPRIKVFNVNRYKTRQECYDEFSQCEDFCCLIINFEKIRIDLNDLKKINFDAIIIDEASKIKATNSTTNKTVRGKKQLNNRGSLKELCKKVEYIFALTATPIETSYYNLFGIFNTIDEDLFSGGFLRFQKRYFLPDYFNRYTIVNKKYLDELKKIVSPYLFVKKVDLNVDVKCDKIDLNFTDKDLIYYKQIMEDIRQKFEKDNPYLGVQGSSEELEKYKRLINERVSFEATNRLYQFCDFPNIVYPTIYDKKYSPKLKWILDNVTKIQGKTIIFDSRTESTNRICEAFDQNQIKYFCIDGSISIKKREKIIENLKNSIDTHILVCSDCMSYGVNVQFCSNMIFFNLAYNPAVLSQRAGRIIRRGQKNKVHIYILSMLNTKEEKICKKINQRINEAENITSELISVKKKDLVKFIEEK